MTDTPLIRAARALAKSDSGEDCYDALDEASQERLQESARAVLGAYREGEVEWGFFDSLCAMILEHDAGGVSLATWSAARSLLAEHAILSDAPR